MSASSSATVEGPPLRLAAIDVGSNAIRFLAGGFATATDFEVLASIRTPVRLGSDVFRNGSLGRQGIDAAVAALGSYRSHMDRLEVADYRAVATSAVRESRNGAQLLDRVKAETGIVLEPIAALEEARLVHVAVRHRVPLGQRRWALVDLGGGSVELSIADAAAVQWSVSHGLGAVRLLQELEGDDGMRRCQHRLDQYVASLDVPEHSDLAGFIATGGNSEALALVTGASMDERGVNRIPLRDLRAVIGTIAGMSLEERVARLGVRAERADVILPAAMVYDRLCEHLGFDTVIVPGVGVREGVLLDLARLRAS